MCVSKEVVGRPRGPTLLTGQQLVVMGACIVTAGTLILHKQRAMPLDGSLFSAFLLTTCGYLLWLEPLTVARRRALQLMGWSTWVLRFTFGGRLVFLQPLEDRYRSTWDSGVIHLSTEAAFLLQQTLTRHIALRWQAVFAVLHAWMFAHWGWRYHPSWSWHSCVVLFVVTLVGALGPLLLWRRFFCQRHPGHNLASPVSQYTQQGAAKLTSKPGAWSGVPAPGKQETTASAAEVHAAEVHAAGSGLGTAGTGLARSAHRSGSAVGICGDVREGADSMACGKAGEGGLCMSTSTGTSAQGLPQCATTSSLGSSQAGATSGKQSQHPHAGAHKTHRVDLLSVAVGPSTSSSLLSSRKGDKGSRSSSRQAISALVKQLRQETYTSQLGSHRKVCLKLHTDLPYTALPPNMATHIQDALTNIDGPAFRCSRVAVRSGCVMLSLDLREMNSCGERGGTWVRSPRNDAQLTKALLDKVQSILNSVAGSSSSNDGEGGGAAGSPLPFEQAMVQVGGLMFQAKWRAEHTAWEMGEAQAATPCSSVSSSFSSSTEGTAWLGTARPTHTRVCTAGLRSSKPSAGLGTDRPAGLAVGMEVQLWGVGAAQLVQGWAPPTPGQHAQASAPAGAAGGSGGGELRLLACCGGSYLTTHVQSTGPSKQAALCEVAQVVVEVPGELLTTHHTGGPASTVLLLNLELWRGEVFISDTPLLAVCEPTQAGPTAAGVPPLSAALSSWWWGAAESSVAAAVADVQACAEALPADTTAPATVPGHLHFLQDLSLWLGQVRKWAQANMCCSATASTSRGGTSVLDSGGCVSLSRGELQQLAAGLTQHAAAVGLQGVHQMVQEQAHTMMFKQPAAGVCVWKCVPHGWYLQAAIRGFPCALCEQQYKQQRLASLRTACSAIMTLASAICNLRALWQQEWRTFLFIAPWALCHAVDLVGLARNGWRPDPRSGQAWSLAGYLCRIAYQWCSSLDCVPRSRVTLGMLSRTLFLAVFALTEQWQVGTVLPAWRVLQVTLLVDLPSACMHWYHGGAHPLLVLLLGPLVVVVLRLLLDSYLRRTLGCNAGGSSRVVGRGKGDGVVQDGATYSKEHVHAKQE